MRTRRRPNDPGGGRMNLERAGGIEPPIFSLGSWCWASGFSGLAVKSDREGLCAIKHLVKRCNECCGEYVITAIPGMISKPVVDVLVEVRSPQAVDERNSEMVAAGYEPRGEYGIEGRRYFVKPADTKGIGFHVHAYERGSSHIDRHLRFRDFLLSHPEVAQEYSALKLSLSDRNGVLVKDYAERKAPFVRRVEGLALDSR